MLNDPQREQLIQYRLDLAKQAADDAGNERNDGWYRRLFRFIEGYPTLFTPAKGGSKVFQAIGCL